MIKIAFFLEPTDAWIGGVNYYRNLLNAIFTSEYGDVGVVVFVPESIEKKIFDTLDVNSSALHIVKTSMLTKGRAYWFLWKFIRKVFGSDFAAVPLILKYKINVVSHSGFCRLLFAKVVNWIPDFQHIYLPDMFSAREIAFRNRQYSNLVCRSDCIIVSSNNALSHLVKFSPKGSSKGKVLKFSPVLPEAYWLYSKVDEAELLVRYNLRKDFIFVPNQFWKHKNHMVLVSAVKILLEKGVYVQVVCSGAIEDHRNPDFFGEIQRELAGLVDTEAFRILGVIPYEDVLMLMKFSSVVINPSLFEGWSSTVEECKNVGKRMILSDIEVHREQMPDAIFFNAMNPAELANSIEAAFDGVPNCQYAVENSQLLNRRNQVEYGGSYLRIIREVLSADKL